MKKFWWLWCLVLASVALSQSAPSSKQLLAVGDIFTCGSPVADITAQMVRDLLTPDTRVALLGDIAYERGTDAEFACFDAAWGDLKPRLAPVAGNHEYYTPNAAGYYRYFGALAGNPKRGYYSYTMAGWQILVLNSNCQAIGGCDAKSPQMAWLRQQLAKNSQCTLAYWHHPRFSSGVHGNSVFMQPMWAALANAKVEVVLSAHDHTYERFARLDAAGKPSPNGILSFVVGTGGRSLYAFKNPHPHSAIKQNSSLGVLDLRLSGGGYTWRFVAQPGSSFTDSGSGVCV
jgi:acid phosphatase type 7